MITFTYETSLPFEIDPETRNITVIFEYSKKYKDKVTEVIYPAYIEINSVFFTGDPEENDITEQFPNLIQYLMVNDTDLLEFAENKLNIKEDPIENEEDYWINKKTDQAKEDKWAKRSFKMNKISSTIKNHFEGKETKASKEIMTKIAKKLKAEGFKPPFKIKSN